jgi:toxin ParE1/3/4
VKAGTGPWAVRLSAAAEADLQDILRGTTARIGAAQARTYAATLSSALEALTAGPALVGARVRDEIAEGLFTLHVARAGRKGRHFVMFRVGRDPERKIVEVLRLLHDAMDLPRHLPPMDEVG